MFDKHFLEIAPYFLALRTVTRESLRFFLDRSESIEKFFGQEQPDYPLHDNSDNAAYSNMMNLVTHMGDIPEEKSMKGAVISVYLFRCLQHAQYFKYHVPEKLKGDRKLHKYETFMLKLLHHLVFVMIHNVQPVKTLITVPGKFFWEKMGLSLNPSFSLVNHNCDPNAFIFNMENQVLLVAASHIHEGEEICISYVPTYLVMAREQRELLLLRNYEFQCECSACVHREAVHSLNFVI